MTQPSAYEQFMLERVNAERAKSGAQALAFDLTLNTAAEQHSAWMIATDTFSHTGAGGSSPTDRMKASGYVFKGSWASAENIAWASTRAPAGLQDEVQLLHTNLMNSPGHRANILNGTYREIGIGFETGEYQGWTGAFATQDFARSGTVPILTGVGFDDRDGDRSYDVGEGMGGITVKAVGASGAAYTTRTTGSGGYQLDLTAGAYTVTFSGGGIVTTTRKVTLGTTNVKLDLVDPVLSAAAAQAVAASVINGTNAGERITGSGHADIIRGLGGRDTILGLGGQDKLHGGVGHDVLNGGRGGDVLTGGAGRDAFVFGARPDANAPDIIRDFSARDDTIRLHLKAFPTLAGILTVDAFYKGLASHDADDRIIYDETSGALFYDADGSGADAAVQFAGLRHHPAITAADFLVV